MRPAAASGPTSELAGEVTIGGTGWTGTYSALVLQRLGLPADRRIIDSGDADGFALLCSGEVDVTVASRPIDDREQAACHSEGIESIGAPIAWAAAAIVTTRPTVVSCLSVADVHALVSETAEGVERWSDATPLARALESTTELPDATFTLFTVGFATQANGVIIRSVIDRFHIGPDQIELRDDVTTFPTEDRIVDEVRRTPGSVGIVSAPAANAASDLVTIAIADIGGECVQPDLDQIAARQYPLAEPVYLYAGRPVASPAVGSVITAFIELLPEHATATGIVPASASDLDAARATFNDLTP